MLSTTGFSLLTFIVLFGGMVVHIAKQFRTARVNQADITIRAYFVEHWPETATGIIGSLVLWMGLPELAEAFPEVAAAIKLGDEVGIFSSFVCGFVGNSLADLVGNRAAAIAGAGGRRESGFVDVRLMLPLALLAALVLAGCSGTKQLYQLASTPPQFAKAVLIHHNALGDEAADLISSPAVSERLKGRIREAYRLTVCSEAERASSVETAACTDGPAWKLDQAGRAYEAARSATTEAELQAAIDVFVPLVVALMNQINEAR